MRRGIDTSNAREGSKANPRDTIGFMAGARARILDESTSSESTPSTEANTVATFIHAASMLKILCMRPEGAE
ncbi:hypothetical protein [Myxococcus sp. CA040A]|uniref:hypothetical protein n=1 Tax=Myxococcus sp. CA040A TaxID=2741738 RepID=UPI00157A5223|nr:hypothetical protein [Myxococcus sp. CA040A]NTX01946.1 hypothetical protein [Myxococcus sp. CA040A]